jgi:translation initiation factor 2B subunit (eIF-2B alpha/beta/delta family)
MDVITVVDPVWHNGSMLAGHIAEQIAEIARDRESGSAELARRAAEVLALAGPEEVEEAAAAVVRAQPAMAAVYNAARAARARRLPEFVAALAREIDASELVAGKVVLTHSWSSTVARAIRAARRVVCTESLPGGEGRKTAAALGGEMIPDTAVYRSMATVDLVVVGADAVTPDAVVNKVGTALVALAARERLVPVWVVCGEEKLVGAEWRPELGDLFERVPRMWFRGIAGA